MTHQIVPSKQNNFDSTVIVTFFLFSECTVDLVLRSYVEKMRDYQYVSVVCCVFASVCLSVCLFIKSLV